MENPGFGGDRNPTYKNGHYFVDIPCVFRLAKSPNMGLGSHVVGVCWGYIIVAQFL